MSCATSSIPESSRFVNQWQSATKHFDLSMLETAHDIALMSVFSTLNFEIQPEWWVQILKWSRIHGSTSLVKRIGSTWESWECRSITLVVFPPKLKGKIGMHTQAKASADWLRWNTRSALGQESRACSSICKSWRLAVGWKKQMNDAHFAFVQWRIIMIRVWSRFLTRRAACIFHL